MTNSSTDKKDVLSRIEFGQRIAEEEGDALSSYFVETDNWAKVYQGSVDIVYGPKGAGKSALYSLLLAKSSELFDRGIILKPAEKPRGTPAFRDIVSDPPLTEREFVGLWKVYFLSLIYDVLQDYGFAGEKVDRLKEALLKENLVKGDASLGNLIRRASDYVKWLFRPEAIEAGILVEPGSQLPSGVTGKIVFREPSPEERRQGFESADILLALADEALASDAKYSIWILLDRLDVAFAESFDLERNALRALFRVYLDLLDKGNLRLKIFLRSDIWKRINQEGFREASHITRHVTISWNSSSLMNLVVRRALYNKHLAGYLSIDEEQVRSSTELQRKVFFRIFPDQIDVGPNKPNSLDWMLSRTRDGTRMNAPRELIHLLNALRAEQMRRYEIGESEPDGEVLFARAAFKEALPDVSETRLSQTLYAEHPDIRDHVERLREKKTLQKIRSLSDAWNLESTQALRTAEKLVEVGFFERRGSQSEPEYWVPFLYRDALDMVQGTAE